MNRSTVKGFAFVIACVLSIVAAVVPYYSVKMDSNLLDLNESVKMISSLWGIILVIVNVVSVAMVFAGLQIKCGFAAAANVVASIIGLIYMEMGMSRAAKGSTALAILNESGIYGQGLGSGNATVTHEIGFYLLIFSAIAVLITGIMFAVERD